MPLDSMTVPSTVELAPVDNLPSLRLPYPEMPFLSCSRDRCGKPMAALDLPSTQVGEAGLSWYRWVLGHHVSVGVWRLMAAYLEHLVTGPRSDHTRALDALAVLHDAYSALILYSGSCSPSVYHAAIRPRMAEHHPAFSGTWARDHERVAVLLGQVGPIEHDRFKEARRFNRRVHMALAKRLVPHDKSLLRSSGRGAGEPTDAERDLFDACFGRERAATCRCRFAEQVAARLALITHDLAGSAFSVTYRQEGIDRFQSRLRVPLARLADLVASTRPEDERS
jgi:L-tyrosine peroxygenase